jgi:uncharacterized protein YndB with AHSA1/START domain
VNDVRLERVLPAPRELVWRAFTDPAALAAWFWPPSFDTTARVEPVTGGEVRIAAADGRMGLSGRVESVEPGRRLGFTWTWDGDDEETFVTVALADADPGTELTLTHTGFADASTRDDHIVGWSDCLDRLPGWLADQS